MSNLRIEISIDDEWTDICFFLQQLCPWMEGDRSSDDLLDLSGCDYLGPFAATIIYSSWYKMRQAGQPFDVLLPTHKIKLDAFCRFSGLKHFLFRQDRPDSSHPSCETVPLQVVYSARADTGSPLIRLLKRHIRLSAESEEYLTLCLQEIVQNVSDHSLSNFGCIWCGRFIHTKDEVRIACVDAGVGIYTSLSKRYQLEGTIDALGKVFTGGYSSQSRANNQGLGVSNLVAWVRELRGDLSFVSSNAVGRVSRDSPAPVFEALPFRFYGTGVFFTVPVTKDESIPDDEL